MYSPFTVNYLAGFNLCFLLLFSCQRDSKTQIIDVFQPVYHIKKVTTKVYTNAFYSNALQGEYSYTRCLFLNSDTTFTYTDEGITSLTGRWRLIKDSVEITPLSEPKNVSFHLTLSRSSASKKVIFEVSDKTGQPIQNFVIQPFNYKPLYIYDSSGLDIDSVNHPNEIHFPRNYCTDSTGTIKLTKNSFDSLDFTKLYPLVRRRFRISTHNLPDTIKLTVNVNAITLSQDIIHPILGHLPPPGKFIVRGDHFIIPID